MPKSKPQATALHFCTNPKCGRAFRAVPKMVDAQGRCWYCAKGFPPMSRLRGGQPPKDAP